jgi:hypothetical protein
MAHTFRALALAGGLIATTLMSVPVKADAPVPGPLPSAFAASHLAPLAQDYHCRGRCGWRDDRRWRRDRVDAGDVLLGAVIIGGLAAIISSENRRKRERDVVVVERDPYIRDARRDRRASGLESAANMCADRIEREQPVETIENVSRTASGWQVSGRTEGGAPFACRIGNDGAIESVDFADGQWSDEAYGAARAGVGQTVPIARGSAVIPPPGPGPRAGLPALAPAPAARMPAYPGGPIPGETIPDEPPQ